MTEISKAVELMTDVRHKTSDVVSHIDQILKKAKGDQYDTSKVSIGSYFFMQVKYMLKILFWI